MARRIKFRSKEINDMKVTGLDGKIYTWKLERKDAKSNESKFHTLAREVLTQLYTLDTIFEEIELPGSKGLIVDFFLPLRKLAVEVNGQQHYEFNQFFHGTIQNFWKSKERDRNKRDWCELNEIQLIELDYRKTEEWTNQILLK